MKAHTWVRSVRCIPLCRSRVKHVVRRKSSRGAVVGCTATAASHGVLGSHLAGGFTGGQAERRQGLGPRSPFLSAWGGTHVSKWRAPPHCAGHASSVPSGTSSRGALIVLHCHRCVPWSSRFAPSRRLHRRSGRKVTGSRPLLALSMRGSTHMSKWCALPHCAGHASSVPSGTNGGSTVAECTATAASHWIVVRLWQAAT